MTIRLNDRGESTTIVFDDRSNNHEAVDDDKTEGSSNDSRTPMEVEEKKKSMATRSNSNQLRIKLISAILYGSCSFLITVTNKIVLTSYSFPSSNVLGVGQMIAIMLILTVSSQFGLVTLRTSCLKKKNIWILASLYLGNLMAGLGGTKFMSLPMLIALRRFSIAITAIGEYFILSVKQSKSIVITIILMMGGSMVAAAADLSFSLIGYSLVMTNNILTAANSIVIKKSMTSREFDKNEILYFNALISILPLILISSYTTNMEEIYNYERWNEFGFILAFLGSCVMGYLLNLSSILCTHHNSPLTTTIIGVIKNMVTTYVGMFIGGDYKFSVANFAGLNISLVGSFVYSYLTFVRKSANTTASSK